LRERKDDIVLLFRKFALDFADQNMVPAIRLTPEAQELVRNYRWPGNIRQLQGVVNRISVLETNRLVSAEVMARYLPSEGAGNLPVRTGDAGSDYMSDRDIIFKILYQLRQDIETINARLDNLPAEEREGDVHSSGKLLISAEDVHSSAVPQEVPVSVQEPVSIQDVSAELIRKALERNGGRRKPAAEELGISERTLYRKIKELGIQ
jgi:DNA-binding NtrC family response regulator